MSPVIPVLEAFGFRQSKFLMQVKTAGVVVCLSAIGMSRVVTDDLNDEDLKLLTEQSSATGQARETPVPEAKILQDIANDFEDDDATGGKIVQQLADIATKRWGKKLSSDKLKTLLDKYKRPENCEDIKATKVNPEIWKQLSPNKRKVDLQLSNMQQVVRKVTFATLQTTNALLQNTTVSTNSNLIIQFVDVVALLGHVNTQLAQFRREQIKPTLKQEYSTICSAEIPLTSQYLFGDELAKQLRDAKESRICGSLFTATPLHREPPFWSPGTLE
ncbi:uncharacterized protein [Montipora capricornis]|uniref:uncharacterized protein n=1 Tax=Montipora capricornis TaxID=246305 RepID=UPI0035F20466